MLLRSALIGTLVVAASAKSGSRAGKPVIALFISSERVVKVGGAVPITVVLTNRSHHDVLVERDVRGTDCQIDVRDEAGEPAPETRFGVIYNGHAEPIDMNDFDPKDFNSATVNIVVKPKKKLAWGLDATRFYRMDRTGKYSISVRRLDPENPALPWVKSNVIDLEIIP